MANQYQISYLIEATDKASATFKQISKNLSDMETTREKSLNKFARDMAREEKISKAKLGLYAKEMSEEFRRSKIKDEQTNKRIQASIKERKSIEKGFIDIDKKRKVENEKALKEADAASKRAIIIAQRDAEKRIKQTNKIIQASIKERKSIELGFGQIDKARAKERKSIEKGFIEIDKKRKAENEKALKEADAASKRAVVIAQRDAEKRIKEEKRVARESINEARRVARERERADNRARVQRRQAANNAYDTASRAALTIAAPVTANALFALHNAMTKEQMQISLRTQFGQESGNLMFKEMRDYSLATAFSMEEAVQLLSDMKIGQKQLGIKTDQELVALTKKMGNILIAFGKNPENRAEIANQLGQIAMSDRASTRQDLRVMQKRGLPVFQALQAFTGKSFTQLKDEFGAELPSKLIMAALEKLADSPQVLKAMDEQSKSLTQSWGNLKEQAFFTSAAYGEQLNKQFGIGKALRGISKALGEVEDKMTGVDKNSLSATGNMIGFGTAMIASVIPLTAASLLLQKMWMASAAVAGNSQLLRFRILAVSGLMSSLYLTTTDWKSLINDIEKDGLAGWIKHLDTVGASALTLLTTFRAIKAAATWAAGATALGFAGAATGGAAVAAYAGYEGGKAFGESSFADKLLNRYYEKTGQENKIIDPEIRKRNEAEYQRQINPVTVNLEVKNETIIDPITGVTKSKTKAKQVRDPYANPVYTHTMWE